MNSLGSHYIADYYQCDRDLISDRRHIKKSLLYAVKLCGATVIKHYFHEFSPQGVSGVIIIAESHLAIHTWPEHGYAALDLFTCKVVDYKQALDYIKEAIAANGYDYSLVKRGVVVENQ